MKKSLRVLFVSNLYPPHEIGGFEQLCQEITEALKERGHSVQVLTSQYGSFQDEIKENGVTRSLFLQADINQYHPLDFFTRWANEEKHNANQLRHTIEDFSPDLIVFWGMWNLSLNLPHLAEQLMPGRVLYYIASFWPSDLDIHLEYWKAPARRVITEMIKRPLRIYALARLAREGYPPRLKFENVKCVSRYVRDELVRFNKLPTSASVLYVGIDPTPFLKYPASPRFDETPLRLVYFGTLIHQKGVHTIIESLDILKKKGLSRPVELTIIGRGRPDYVIYLKDQVMRFGLTDSVLFVDHVSRDQIPMWLSKFDIFIFSSMYAEAMARAVMEAMATSLLVIASRVGGQVEMLADRLNSLTFTPGNAEDLAIQIIYAIQHPLESIRFAEAGQRLVLEKFTLENMVSEIENWLEKITIDSDICATIQK